MTATRVAWGVLRGLGRSRWNWARLLLLVVVPPFIGYLLRPYSFLDPGWVVFVGYLGLLSARFAYDVGSAHPGLPISRVRRQGSLVLGGAAAAAVLGAPALVVGRADVLGVAVLVGGLGALAGPAAARAWTSLDLSLWLPSRTSAVRLSGPTATILRELWLRTPLGIASVVVGVGVLLGVGLLPSAVGGAMLSFSSMACGFAALGEAHQTRRGARIPAWLPLSNASRLRATLVVHGSILVFQSIVGAVAVAIQPDLPLHWAFLSFLMTWGMALGAANSAQLGVRIAGGLILLTCLPAVMEHGMQGVVPGASSTPLVVELVATALVCGYAAVWGAARP